MIAAAGLGLRAGRATLLADARFEVQRGAALLLAGPSGSGKSTLLRALLGLRRPGLEARGEARLAGLDALRTPTPLLARRAGLLFQDAGAMLTQPDAEAELAFRLENLGLPRRDVEDRVASAVRAAELGPLLGRPLHALSGGELKRLALAALRAAHPAALLLDEPLGGLDEAWAAREARWLRRPEPAVLVVEHRARALRGLAALHLHGARLSARPAPAVPVRRAAPPRDAPPWVRAEDLRVALGGREVLRGATFALQPGVTLLTGPNGGGKSTLLRALLGLAPRDAGSVQVAGLDPASAPRARLAREVGYVPQHAEDMFSCASAREELAVGPRHLLGAADPLELEALARSLGLGALLDRHPFTLSGGERQRLALACALAHRPRVLLLDEPTVGMDAPGVQRLASALEPVRQRGAVLVATHDEALLPLADHVLRLRQGRVERARAVET